jgi:hypothetical protein
MRYQKLLLGIILLGLCWISCKKTPDVEQSSSAMLSFSTDTLWFDTVFTTRGSITKRIRFYNTLKKDLIISSIRLGNGNASAYRINIDGSPASSITDYRIASGDSAIVFVEVTIDPNNSISPFLVLDSILFTTNTNLQKVYLGAYGQNANYLKDSIISSNTTWTSTLPYVIVGQGVLVDTNVVLTIEKGTRVHFGKLAQLFVAGTLKVNGALGDTVVFQGDRLEQLYNDEPGQWNSIQFIPPSRNNTFNYAIVKNAIFGIIVGTLPSDPNIDVLINNSKIMHMSATGIFGINGKVSCYNSVFLDCAQHAMLGAYGGNYEFVHNTIGNFNTSGFSRSTPSMLFTDVLLDTLTPYSQPLIVNLVNNIIWGNNADELELSPQASNYTFTISNNLIRDSKQQFGPSNVYNKDPLFTNFIKEDLSIDTTISPAHQAGVLVNSALFTNDIEGNLRKNPPSIGAYEIY